MSCSGKFLIDVCRIVMAIALPGLLWQPLSAEDRMPEELQACRPIEDADARAVCYDKIVDRHWPDDVVMQQQSDGDVTFNAAGESTYVELNDEIGRESLDVDEESVRDNEIITGTVIECRQDALQNYYFVFDNGQVWKQKSDSRLKFEVCNFEVTISKDLFGYKMQQVGERRRIRISRVR